VALQCENVVVSYDVAAAVRYTEEGEDSSKTTDQTWGDTDRDYTYDEVLPLYCTFQFTHNGVRTFRQMLKFSVASDHA